MLDMVAQLCNSCGTMQTNYDFIMAELPKAKGHWQQVAAQAGVTYSWLSKVACGKIPNPGVRGVDCIAAVLRERNTQHRQAA